MSNEAPARKDDAGKDPWHLVPWDAVRGIVKVLDFGAKKYAPRNWEMGLDYSRVYSALMRHITSWWDRDKGDPDTGFSHLWHAGCCILFLIALEMRGVGVDDRPTLVPPLPEPEPEPEPVPYTFDFFPGGSVGTYRCVASRRGEPYGEYLVEDRGFEIDYSLVSGNIMSVRFREKLDDAYRNWKPSDDGDHLLSFDFRQYRDDITCTVHRHYHHQEFVAEYSIRSGVLSFLRGRELTENQTVLLSKAFTHWVSTKTGAVPP